MNHIEVLKRAFLALDDEQLGNLEWHRANGTTICCGEGSKTWVTPDGAG